MAGLAQRVPIVRTQLLEVGEERAHGERGLFVGEHRLAFDQQDHVDDKQDQEDQT